MRTASLTFVRGVRVGHATAPEVPTGVTAILFDGPAPTVVDVRGGASGTYDTGSLALDATFGGRCGLFFSGGSQFGLDAARGVRNAILEQGGGVGVFGHPTRLAPVSGAVLFDLPPPGSVWIDYLPYGYAAAKEASTAPVRSGRVGAGAGATLGKYRGRLHSTPGGLASRAVVLRGGGRVGVLVVVNAVGAIFDESRGRFIAGSRDDRGRLIPPDGSFGTAERGTTLAAVVTDVPLERRQLARLAVAAHDGLARAIRPVHTATDGDVVFATATTLPSGAPAERRPGAEVDRIGPVVADLTVATILDVGRSAPRRSGPVRGG